MMHGKGVPLPGSGRGTVTEERPERQRQPDGGEVGAAYSAPVIADGSGAWRCRGESSQVCQGVPAGLGSCVRYSRRLRCVGILPKSFLTRRDT